MALLRGFLTAGGIALTGAYTELNTNSRMLNFYVVLAASNSIQIAKLQSDCGTLYTVVAGDGCFSITGAAKITPAQLAAQRSLHREGHLGGSLCIQA